MTYVALGSYIVYANRSQGPQTVLYANRVTISGATNLAIPLAPAKTVSGAVTVDGTRPLEPVTVTFDRAQGGTFRSLTEPTGTYRVSVPDGDFTVSVDARTTVTISGAQRFVRILFTGSLSIPATATAMAFDVRATRTLDNATIAACNCFAAGLRFFDISNVSSVKEIAYFKPPAQGTKVLPGSQYAAAVPATFVRNFDMSASKPSFPKDRAATTGDIWTTSHDNGFMVVKLASNATASSGGGCASADASIGGLLVLGLAQLWRRRKQRRC